MPNCVSLGRPLGGRPGGSPRTSMGWDMTHRGRHRSYQGRPRTPRGRPNCPADVHGTVDALRTQQMVSDCTIGKFEHHARGLTTLRQANVGNDMENIPYIWFSHFTLTETHWWKNYSLSLYFKNKKGFSHVDPFTGNIETVYKIVGLQLKKSKMMLTSIHIIANQNSYHDDELT